ncbi:hypothetical protein [Aquimarina spongiae]|uniref:Uncharacterized protein n=1 Tax=Aquimarina spongiae TaxID=570521 RepID=A0A1M6JTH6_9FLAO|nr:hypothetical protein [Aquimarina spongiae]SHJ49988.1 hypothetical protein SAMN04488508_109239 [Aquimarina spongiae]
MKHTIVVVLSILSIHSSILCQETLSIEEMQLKGGLSDRRESIPVINDKTDELSLFIVDRKKFYLNKYNTAFELVDQKQFDRPKKSAKNIIKAIVTDYQYVFLLANDKKTRFELLKFDAEHSTTIVNKDPLFSDDESYVEAFTYRNQICVMTLQKKTSKLNIYKIDVTGAKKTMHYDFGDVVFLDKLGKEIPLYKSLQKSTTGLMKSSFDLGMIETDIPNALEIAAKSKKIYIEEDSIIISIDNDHKTTQLLTLNLEDNTYDARSFKKPDLLYVKNNENIFIKSNSFLANNRLYQIVGKKGQMRLFVTDIHSKELVKQLALQKEDSITFKNSPIIQEGGYYSNYREMEKTQKFLRKIASGDIAVAVQQLGDTTKVTLGGVKEINTGGGYGMPMMGFGAIGGAMTGLANAFMTPTFYAYSSYTTTKSTRIHCLFNEQLDHLSGEVSKNAFDKIKEFSKELLNEKAETIFKYNGYYVYGYYESLHKRYYLRKFMD